MKKYIVLLLFASISSGIQSQDLYWVNKDGGNFQDPNNWSEQSGGDGGAGVPDGSINAIFDKNSGLESDDQIMFLAGSTSSVYALYVDEDAGSFTFAFLGEASNPTTLDIYGDIFFHSNGISTYFEDPGYYNVINFRGDDNHKIDTRDINLNYVQFIDPAVDYILQSDLRAEFIIRLYGGTLIMDDHEVTTLGTFFCRDNNPSSSSLPKAVVADGGVINCFKFQAKLAYDLTMSGEYTVFCNIFEGSPRSSEYDPPKVYDKIVLLNYEPGSGQGGIIEDNNLSCVGCTFTSVTIEDDEVTQIAGGVHLETLIITHTNNTIEINDGNSYPNEIYLDEVVTPALNYCRTMPILKPRSDLSTITVNKTAGNNGTIAISRMEIRGMVAGDATNYTLDHGILGGGSIGWNVGSSLPPRNYEWLGTDPDHSWFNVHNWIELSGIEGCRPTANDNVNIVKDSQGPLILPDDTEPACRDFIWSKENEPMTFEMSSPLSVNGDLFLSDQVNITEFGPIKMQGNQQSLISSKSYIPRLDLNAPGIAMGLAEEINCGTILFSGGDFHTNNFDILADSWHGHNLETNNFYFGSSEITVNGEFRMAYNEGNTMTVHPGTSKIICESFFSPSFYDFHDVTLINPSGFTFANSWPYTFNVLELRGNGAVVMNNDMEVNQLLLEDEDAELRLGSGVELTVLDFVSGPESAGNIPAAKITGASSSNPATISKPNGNFCFKGHIDFENIEGVAEGVVHAPYGNDLSNNTGINFTPFITDQSVPLYWIGRTNTNLAIRSNWSTLSGGCSTNYTPTSTSRPSLIFDENSVYEDEEVVIYTITTVKKLEFRNIIDEFVVDNRVGLTLTDLEMDAAYVKYIGQDFDISNKLLVKNASVLLLEASKITTPLFSINTNTYDNLVIIRDSSKIEVFEN